jgi:hypothetical protein
MIGSDACLRQRRPDTARAQHDVAPEVAAKSHSAGPPRKAEQAT